MADNKLRNNVASPTWQERADKNQRDALDNTMRELLHEIRLLNARFEEAFRTNITSGDVPDED